MDHHLNVFRFFHESTEKEFIENNLSRAFAVCLKNNSFFLSEYIKGIVTQEDYQYLFSSVSSDARCSIDVQIDTATIEVANYKTVYAVAMTSDSSLNMDDFFTQPEYADKRNITDILVTVKDVALIIEVKRTWADCKAQLFNQVLPFRKENKDCKILPIKFSWQEMVKLLETVKHVQQLVSQKCIFIADFLELSEIRYPEWFESKPFAVIPFLTEGKTSNQTPLMKRMRQALVGVSTIAMDYQLLPYDRLGISLPFGWASELIPYFSCLEDSVKNYVDFWIWPADTKQQGYSLFNKPVDWTAKNSLLIEGNAYKLDINYRVKLCHFNRYVASLEFSNNDIIKPLHTKENFHDYSGRWTRDTWKELEQFFDEHFKPEFKWRENCEWDNNFINTDRGYLTMSLGFAAGVYIPFSVFTAIDRRESGVAAVSAYIIKIAEAFRSLIN